MNYSSPAEKQTTFEHSVIKAFKTISSSRSQDLKLDNLHVVRAEEIEVAGSKKAGIIYVPAEELAIFQKDSELIGALQKEFKDYQMFIVASRATAGKRGNTDFHKSIKHINECLEDDICFPYIVAGRRTLFHANKQTQKIVIDATKKAEFQTRSDVCEQVLRKLTKRNVDILFI